MTSFPLTALLRTTEVAGQDYPPVTISGLTADSRAVKKDFLFAALPGVARDGRDYIADAVAKGASAILVPFNTPPIDAPGSIAVIHADEPRLVLAQIAATFYPKQPETIVAVTGTSGKTSTVQFVREIWTELGEHAASIGTLGIIGGAEKSYGNLTTPDAITLHQALDRLSGEGISRVAMEASSHGLSMFRLDAVKIRAAGFTNLSRDHLDYHGTMENYLHAKQRLFYELLPHDGTAVINVDDPVGESFAKNIKSRVLTYGRKGKDLTLQSVTPTGNGLRIEAGIFGRPHTIHLPVMGQFQAWNALCALGFVLATGTVDPVRAVAALARVSGVPGRLQLAGQTKTGAYVFVDYSHKPDALENVLTAIRLHVTGRLVVVFGCGGNRDKGKRPIMGEIACRLADVVVVTDDNPRHEDAATIRAEVLAGCNAKAHEVGDRAAAIHDTIEQLQSGDVLVIAGKGHETGQIVGDTVLPFDDMAVAKAALDG